MCSARIISGSEILVSSTKYEYEQEYCTLTVRTSTVGGGARSTVRVLIKYSPMQSVGPREGRGPRAEEIKAVDQEGGGR